MNELLLSSNVRKDLGEGVEFLGETNGLINYSSLSSYFGVSQGTVNSTTGTNRWLRFRIDSKELYVSKIAVRSAVSWFFLYSKGLVYGTNNNGLYPTGTPTNQYKTILLGDKLYKCRLLKGYDSQVDPFTVNAGYDFSTTQQSEWSRIFYPIITNDPNIKSYTGPMLANYLEADLQMRWVNINTTPGSASWCQESRSVNTSEKAVRGEGGASYIGRGSNSSTDIAYGWRPVLELV